MIPIAVLTDVTLTIEDTDEDLVVSHVYSYIPYSKELVVSMFLDTFRIQRIWSFLMFIDTFRIQKCLETVKQQNSLICHKSHYFAFKRFGRFTRL